MWFIVPTSVIPLLIFESLTFICWPVLHINIFPFQVKKHMLAKHLYIEVFFIENDSTTEICYCELHFEI